VEAAVQIFRVNQAPFPLAWENLREEALPRSALCTPLDRQYLINYPNPWEPHDLSFLIENEGTPLAGALMALKPLPQGFELSAFGRPIFYLERPGLKPFLPNSVYSLLKEELERIRAAYPIREIHYQNPEGQVTTLGKYLLDEGARATPFFSQVVQLEWDESALRQMVRKSYKNLINWGEKHLRPYVVERANLSDTEFEAYRELHFLAAGRETRSRATWRINAEMIREGQAFLVLGRLDGRLVTGAYFNVFRDACYYSNAASDRDLFDKPLGHSVIWRGLLHAKALGCRRFEMGDIFFPNQPLCPGLTTKAGKTDRAFPDEKDLNIAKFKRGFGGRTECRLDVVWRSRS
jgi:hypothetical protein